MRLCYRYMQLDWIIDSLRMNSRYVSGFILLKNILIMRNFTMYIAYKIQIFRQNMNINRRRFWYFLNSSVDYCSRKGTDKIHLNFPTVSLYGNFVGNIWKKKLNYAKKYKIKNDSRQNPKEH